MSNPLNDEALKHFIALARRGKHPGASGGEKRAAQLASVVVNQLPGLDQDAMDGLCEFIRLTYAAATTAAGLLD